MPIKYIGKPSKFKGKLLFEILGNLRNFGIGRVIIRTSYLRYPEPTFYRITKVEPQMDPENKFGTVWAEEVFRGVRSKNPVIPSPFSKDFQLLSKEDEKEYCKILHEEAPKKVLPSAIPFPPLFKEFVLRDMKERGEKITEEPLLPLVLCEDKFGTLRYRKAEDGEKPTAEFTTHASLDLYKDVLSEEVEQN